MQKTPVAEPLSWHCAGALSCAHGVFRPLLKQSKGPGIEPDAGNNTIIISGEINQNMK